MWGRLRLRRNPTPDTLGGDFGSNCGSMKMAGFPLSDLKMKTGAMLSNILPFLPVEKIYNELVPISMAIGIGIGFLGSFTTVRKHLHV